METKHSKESTEDRIIKRITSKCWYEDDGSAAVYYEVVESVIQDELPKLQKQRDDLLEALIQGEKELRELYNTVEFEGKFPVRSTLDKMINAINKATT